MKRNKSAYTRAQLKYPSQLIHFFGIEKYVHVGRLCVLIKPMPLLIINLFTRSIFVSIINYRNLIKIRVVLVHVISVVVATFFYHSPFAKISDL